MKLLVDMNLSPRWVGFLADAQIVSVHWSTIGPGNTPDSEIMAYAKAHSYIVLTHDLDFSAILAATRGEKPSVVQIRSEDVSLETIGLQVLSALRQMETELEEGALLTVDPNRTDCGGCHCGHRSIAVARQGSATRCHSLAVGILFERCPYGFHATANSLALTLRKS